MEEMFTTININNVFQNLNDQHINVIYETYRNVNSLLPELQIETIRSVKQLQELKEVWHYLQESHLPTPES